jgi:superfamily II DNA/RNA helicase
MNSFETFAQLRLPDALADSLGAMGFLKPTPVQVEAIPTALAGRDVLATAQTGTGKTGAFGIPLLKRLHDDERAQALVLAPTRELAAQIHQVLQQMSRGMGLHGALVIGGESFNRQADELDRGVAYIVATPGRLNDHLEAGTLILKGYNFLVLDEVDRMLDMGFIPQIKKIVRQLPTQRQTLLFSATLPQEITAIAAQLLHEPERIAIGEVSQPNVQVVEQTIRTTNEGKIPVIVKELKSRDGKVLVFARTQARTERLAKLLHGQGFPVVKLHGGRSQGQRKQALEDFRSGSRRIMVATDLAGRGIDVSDIEHVINYDVPQSREDYIHRIGRTGRFGRDGFALNLLVTGDRDGEQVLSGEKLPPRMVFRSSRRSSFRRR